MIPVRIRLRLFPWLLAGLSVYWITSSWLPSATPPPADAHGALGGPGPAETARRAAAMDIPARYLALYWYAAPHYCPGLDWSILAGIGKVESDHGRSRLPGVRSGWNRAGAAGPMQFGIGKGRAGNAWARFGRGGSPYDPAAAIPAAARYLCAHGAPGNVRAALHAYNPSWAYVARVQAIARRYQAGRPAR